MEELQETDFHPDKNGRVVLKYNDWSSTGICQSLFKETICDKLLSLDISFNNLSIINNALFDCWRLKELSVASNKIQVIPDGIRKLRHLERLEASGNMLKRLTSAICHCKKLAILHLNENQLESLSGEVACLTNLKELHLQNNSLQKIPPRLGHYYCTKSHQSKIHIDLTNNTDLQMIPKKLRSDNTFSDDVLWILHELHQHEIEMKKIEDATISVTKKLGHSNEECAEFELAINFLKRRIHTLEEEKDGLNNYFALKKILSKFKRRNPSPVASVFPLSHK